MAITNTIYKKLENGVSLTWSTDEASVSIYRYLDGGARTFVATPLSASYTDTIPQSPSTVVYELYGNTSGTSYFTPVIDLHYYVRSVGVFEQPEQFLIYWSTNETYVRIYRNINGGQSWDYVGLASSSEMVDAKDPSWDTVQYEVIGFDGEMHAYSQTLIVGLPSISTPATVAIGGTINISWTYDYPDATFDVDRSVNDGNFVTVATGISVKTFSEAVNSVWSVGSDVKYRVRAIVNGNPTIYSTSNSITIIYATPTLTAPASVMAGTTINLSWADINSGATYTLERKTGSSWITLSSALTNKSYSDTTSSSWTTAEYRVKAGDAYTSYYSNVVVVEITPAIPDTPSVTVPSTIMVNEIFSVFWSSPTANIVYTVERSINSGAYSAILTDTALKNTAQTPESNWNTVRYRVKAKSTVDSKSSDWGYSPLRTITVTPLRVFADGEIRNVREVYVKVNGGVRQAISVWVKVNGVLKEVTI